MRASYTLFQMQSGDFAFTFLSSEGEPLLTSLSFAQKDSVLRRINAMRSFGQRAESFLTRVSEDGKRYFLLRNKKQEIFAQSEMFVDEESLQQAISAVRRTARTARLHDRTEE